MYGDWRFASIIENKPNIHNSIDLLYRLGIVHEAQAPRWEILRGI
jgi:hypothetical protein